MAHRQLPLSERWLWHLPPLKEASGPIGVTSDGNLPALTVSASYQQSEVQAIRDAVREVAHTLNALTDMHRRG